MPFLSSPKLSSIFLIISLLPAVISYDCSQLSTSDTTCPSVPSPLHYPLCAVNKFSVSAFIQCANAQGRDAPQFTLSVAGNVKQVGPAELLSSALGTWRCTGCPLAEKIQSVWQLSNFRKNLCDYNPVDAGICCLRQCINRFQAPLSAPQEHSIEAFCGGKVDDLMNAPLLPVNCVDNRDPNTDLIGDDDGPPNGTSADETTGETTDNQNAEETGSLSTASSGDESLPMSSTDNSNSLPSSTASAVPSSPTTANAAAAGTTNPVTTRQGTPSEAFRLRKPTGWVDRVIGLGLTVLPVVLAF